jgi:predicted aspartyl protease
VPGRTWATGPDVDVTFHGDGAGAHFETLHGVIDTGASVICVDNRIVRRLGLVASDRRRVQMADGRITTSTVYRARMSIPDLGFDDLVQVFAIEYAFEGAIPDRRVLLGRSFLRNYIVNYDGPRERFEFHETSRGEEFYLDPDE